MRRIAASAVLLTTFILAFTALSASSFAQAFPTVVATAKLTNQTAAITKTTLFTPPADGMYRITAYLVTTVPATNGTKADWFARANWTDDASSWIYANVATVLAYQRTNSVVCCNPLNYVTFWAQGGTPISYAVPAINGDPTGSTYEVFLALEQLM